MTLTLACSHSRRANQKKKFLNRQSNQTTVSRFPALARTEANILSLDHSDYSAIEICRLVLLNISKKIENFPTQPSRNSAYSSFLILLARGTLTKARHEYTLTIANATLLHNRLLWGGGGERVCHVQTYVGKC